MTDHIDATQEDIAAAKAWVNRPRGHSDEQADALEAFTRHRLASTAALQAERDALAKRVEALEGALKQIWTRRYGDWCEIARKALGEVG